MKARVLTFVALLIAGSFLSPLVAQGLGYRGWGPRVGLSSDPDQVVGGVHLNLGEIVDQLRLQPAFEAGFGDDHTVIQATIPVLWRFEAAGATVTPYAGGGVGVAFVDHDHDRGRFDDEDDSDVEIGPVGVGGFEWPLRGGGDMFLELNVAGSGLPDAKLLVGWQLRR